MEGSDRPRSAREIAALISAGHERARLKAEIKRRAIYVAERAVLDAAVRWLDRDNPNRTPDLAAAIRAYKETKDAR